MIIGFGISPSRVKKTGGAVAFDADAEAFFTAASITDATQKNAINQLVLDLKSYNIWTKMKALYPICGGSASSHSVNLKTPGTYNLTFSTGWTHASTGMTPSSAYANTSFIPNTNLTDSNNHASFYSRINATAANVCEIGSYDNSSPAFKFFGMQIKFTGDLFLVANGTNPYPTVSNTDSKGFYIMTKNSSTSVNVFKNSSKIMNAGTTGSGISTTNVWIGAFNANGSAANYTTKECAFASIGDGLTDTEAANFYTAVNAYQTTLSRNV